MRKQPLAKGAPGVTRKWERLIAWGCTHGHLANKDRLDEVIAFRDSFQPVHRFELGDVVDTAAFRSGARGTKDESEPIEPDRIAAVDWIKRSEPTRIFWGNHCWRVYELMSHHSAIVAAAAGHVWHRLDEVAKEVGAKTHPYDFEKGWYKLGGYHYGHGYWYGEQAVRDHAEFVGGPCCIAHLHAPQQVSGRTLIWSPSFCTGTLAEIDRLTYARRRRSTARWGAGFVAGEACDTESKLWLVSAAKGESLRFPFL